MPKLVFKGGREITASKGASILDSALENGVGIYHTCGGNASCSTCRIRVISGGEHLTPIEAAEAEVLDAFDLKQPHRLSCQAVLRGGDVEVEIPKWERTPRPNKTPPVP